MRVCELIEWLKRQDSLAEVEIEIIDYNYPDITTFNSGIKEIRYLGEFLNKVRLIAEVQAKTITKENK